MGVTMRHVKTLQLLYIGTDAGILHDVNEAKHHLEIKTLDSPMAAIQYLGEGHAIACILCEQHIYGMKGLDFLKQLSEFANISQVPKILLCRNQSEAPKSLTDSVIDDIYIPPVSFAQLSERIKFLTEFKKRSADSAKDKGQKRYKIPVVKRIFDIVFSLGAIIALSPILIIAAYAIRLESKGKVYYTSKRVGTGYKIFEFYKLRSMFTGADQMIKQMAALNQYVEKVEEEEKQDVCPRCTRLGHACSPILHVDGKEICEFKYLETKKNQTKATFVKIKDDPRITKVGRFIRNTSIDELPQLFNVLKGDMSIVGNRPLPLYEAELLTTDDWTLRFKAPAGITGLWQVMKRGRATKMSPEERKMLDNEYANTYSVWSDLVIIIKTFRAVFQSENV